MITELKKINQLKWKAFLSTEAGVEGLLVLRESSPTINGNGEQHAIVFAAGQAAGYGLALDRINSMLAVEPKKEIELENK
jgi:hypothetical protein